MRSDGIEALPRDRSFIRQSHHPPLSRSTFTNHPSRTQDGSFSAPRSGRPIQEEDAQCAAVHHRRIHRWCARDCHHVPSRVCVHSAAAQELLTDGTAVAKTRSQLNRRLEAGKKLPWPPFGAQWYAGCTTLIIGNSAKAGIRREPTPRPVEALT
jgi:hypothetical protein